MYENVDDAIAIYVGNGPYDDPSKYEISFKDHHSSTMLINSKILLKLCQTDRILE